MEIPELLTPREAAKALHSSYGSLAVARCKRRKPLPFVRLGRKIFYTKEAIAKYIASQTDPGTGPRPNHKVVRRRRVGK